VREESWPENLQDTDPSEKTMKEESHKIIFIRRKSVAAWSAPKERHKLRRSGAAVSGLEKLSLC
jgi:hypothetical protein